MVYRAGWPAPGDRLLQRHNDADPLEKEHVLCTVRRETRGGPTKREYAVAFENCAARNGALSLAAGAYGVAWRFATEADVVAQLGVPLDEICGVKLPRGGDDVFFLRARADDDETMSVCPTLRGLTNVHSRLRWTEACPQDASTAVRDGLGAPRRATRPQVCGRKDDEDRLVLCDGRNGACNHAAHTRATRAEIDAGAATPRPRRGYSVATGARLRYCAGLSCIPDGEWFCRECRARSTSTAAFSLSV